ncbi:MAG: twin-arginine translocase subunit TatC [Candidatus Geothermarchaeales archaeon]
MSFLEHIDELRRRLIVIIVAVGSITVFCFTFGIKNVEIGEYSIYIPYPNIYRNISALFLERLKSDLLPEYVKLIVTTPAQAMVALIYVSLFLGIAFGMPVIIFELARFIGPGLYSHEKKVTGKIILPASGLFLLGAIFSYRLVIPWTIDFLFRYGVALDVETFLTIEGFISFVLLFILAFGLSFQLPIVMVVLSSLDIVDPGFWKRNFRYAVLGMLIFGAIITPDGSGITMFMVAAPMIVLYLAGYLVAVRGKKKE